MIYVVRPTFMKSTPGLPHPRRCRDASVSKSSLLLHVWRHDWELECWQQPTRYPRHNLCCRISLIKLFYNCANHSKLETGSEFRKFTEVRKNIFIFLCCKSVPFVLILCIVIDVIFVLQKLSILRSFKIHISIGCCLTFSIKMLW